MKKLFGGLAIASLALGISVSAFATSRTARSVDAYGSDDTTWYVDAAWDSWNKANPRHHLTYSGMSGNNWQFDSDYAIYFPKDQMFKVCYSWGGGANANEFVPNRGTNQDDFYVDDGLKASRDIYALLYFQVYQESASWTGLYWTEVTEDQYKIINWSVDFLKATDSKCAGDPNDDHSVGLATIWNEQKSSFEALGDSATSLFNTYGNPKVEAAKARYLHIVKRYNSLEAFEGAPSAVKAMNYIEKDTFDNNALLIVTATIGAAVLSVGALFLIRKRKAE